MSGVGIIADSSACLPPCLVETQGVRIIPMIFAVNGREYRDGTEMTTARFYEMLPSLKTFPTTSPSPPGTFTKMIREMAGSHSGTVCITVSKTFSGTYDSALAGADMARAELKGMPIEVLDSGTAAGAHGLVVLAASRAARSGASFREVVSAARHAMSRAQLVAMLDTVKYLARGGRVPKVAYWATSALQIKPVLRLTPLGGGARLAARARTKARAVDIMFRMVREDSRRRPLRAIVQHANAIEEALKLKERLMAEYECLEVFVNDFTPAMGTHTGPGLLAIAYITDE